MFILIFLLVAFSYLSFVHAQDSGINTTGIQSDAEKIRNATQVLQNFTERAKYEFLADKWKEFLLKDKGFAKFDGFLENLSFVFFIFTGMFYKFSPLFFVVIFMWLFHFWILSNYIFLYFPLKRGVGILVCVGILIVLSQLKYMIFISQIFLSIALWGEGFVWRFLSFALSILILLLIFGAVRLLKKRIKMDREKLEKLVEKGDRAVLHKIAEGARNRQSFLSNMFESWREMGESGV